MSEAPTSNLTPEAAAAHAAALEAIKTLNSVPAPVVAPAIGDKATEPAKRRPSRKSGSAAGHRRAVP